MSRARFIKEMTLTAIEGASAVTGLWIMRRLRFRLIWGAWCKHWSWTPWKRIDERGRRMRECEGCFIRQTRW